MVQCSALISNGKELSFYATSCLKEGADCAGLFVK